MLNQSNYTEFIEKLNTISQSNNEIFIETYSFIDLLLREVLEGQELAFTTSRARFLYVATTIDHSMKHDMESNNPYPLPPISYLLKKAGSLVFNIHNKIFDRRYIVSEIEKNLAIYVFEELYNYFLVVEISDFQTIQILSELQKVEIYQYLEEKLQPKSPNKEKLDCYMKELKVSKTKYGFPLYEIIATDDFGEEIKVYLWIESEKPAFHRRLNVIVDFYVVGRQIRFFDISWSEKGYYFQNNKTSFVIEPDFLIDITAVAECFQKNDIIPELYFLKFTQSPVYNLAILKGGLVNTLLDAVICNDDKDIDLEETLNSILRKQFLKVLDLTENDFKAMLKEVEDIHFKNLIKVAKFYKGKKITLEPTFISAEYGLQGRLDALVEFPDDESNKTIFELKSGSPPHQNLWQNHYAQVMGYNILLKSVFKGHTRGHSSILYSKAYKNTLRNISPSEISFSQILMCRNIIVNKLFHNANYISQLNTLLSQLNTNKSNIPSYLQNDVRDFCELYNSLKSYEKIYFNTMTTFVLKELIAQKIGYFDSSGVVRHGFSALWNLSLDEKIKQKSILRLQFTNHSTLAHGVKSHPTDLLYNNATASTELNSDPTVGRQPIFHFHIKRESDLSGFREGDLLLLYPAIKELQVTSYKLQENQYPQSQSDIGTTVVGQNELTNHYSQLLTADPLSVPIFKAVLKKITPESVSVQFRNELLTAENLNDFECFFAEKDMMESGYTSNIASMLKFFSIDKDKREVFFGLKEPRYIQNDNLTKGILSKQTELTDRILNKAAKIEDYLLIQGPPGTGKTSKYLISIIKQHLTQKTTPVVVLAFTNRAVEEICIKLSENEMKFILLGTNHTDAEYHISSIISEEYCSDRIYSVETIKKKLSETRVFISTVANFQNEGYYLKKNIKTDLLIVDEASQLLENQLIGIIAYFNKFILIGDHYQLPAVSTQNIENLHKEMTDTIGIKSIQESLFERLYRRCVEKDWHHAFDMLPAHYRMHKEIADLVNPFYDNKLTPANQRQYSQLTNFKTQIVVPELASEHVSVEKILNHRTLFFPTIEKTFSRYNTEEALKTKEIIIIVYGNRKENFTENTIGVICAWKLQVNLIHSILSDLPYHSMITVDTVERFQGSERDIIIYSTAISSPDLMKNLQSLTNDGKVDRKLNVAISRAKEQFIFLGNKEILSISPHYKRVIEHIEMRKKT